MKTVSYALGMSVAHNFLQSGVKTLNKSEYMKGLEDFIDGKADLTPDECNKILQEYFETIRKEQTEAAIAAGQKYLEENAKKPGVNVTESGLQYSVLLATDGKSPARHGQVECHYEGRLIDGTVFDSSYQRGQTAKFGLDQVIKGWTEGLQLMTEGSKFEFTIPSELAYGEVGVAGVIPPHSVLVFTVELVKVL